MIGVGFTLPFEPDAPGELTTTNSYSISATCTEGDGNKVYSTPGPHRANRPLTQLAPRLGGFTGKAPAPDSESVGSARGARSATLRSAGAGLERGTQEEAKGATTSPVNRTHAA